MYEDRRTGRTTRQIENLPYGAIFIWCSGSTHCPKMLAKKLGREDVEIFSISVLDQDTLRGREVTGMGLDHAAKLSTSQLEKYNMLRVCVRV